MRDLSSFTKAGYDKGRSTLVQAVWFAVMNLVFLKWWCPAGLRVLLLKAFGATIGPNVLVRHRVRILWPWKLTVGANSWIGEGAWLLNLEPITIGHDVCISQEVLLCTGGHDARTDDFRYRNGPIWLHAGSWVGARAVILPGVTVGAEAVVAANATIRQNVAERTTVFVEGRTR